MAAGKYQAAVKLTPKEFEGVEHLVKAGYFLNVSDFVRSAVRDKLEALKPTLVRRISSRAAQQEIYRYIKSHPDVYPDEIADALNLDIGTVMDTVAALMLKKKVGESI
jgi:Arc/MetJ-type ribon-helix-helix transcriptional regulator